MVNAFTFHLSQIKNQAISSKKDKKTKLTEHPGFDLQKFKKISKRYRMKNVWSFPRAGLIRKMTDEKKIRSVDAVNSTIGKTICSHVYIYLMQSEKRIYFKILSQNKNFCKVEKNIRRSECALFAYVLE